MRILLCNVIDFSEQKKMKKIDSRRTLYVLDKVNLDLQNVQVMIYD